MIPDWWPRVSYPWLHIDALGFRSGGRGFKSVAMGFISGFGLWDSSVWVRGVIGGCGFCLPWAAVGLGFDGVC